MARNQKLSYKMNMFHFLTKQNCSKYSQISMSMSFSSSELSIMFRSLFGRGRFFEAGRLFEEIRYVLWCLSIYEYKPLLLLLGSALFEFLRPEDKCRALQGCTETSNKVCQIFKEVGGVVRRESATELENLLNL